MDQSLEVARKYSPALRIQKNKQEQVKLDYRSALGSALPQVAASYDVQRFLKKPTFGGFSLNSNWEKTVSVTVSQVLYSFGGVSNALDAANHAVDISKLNEAMTQLEVEYAVKLSFYSIHLAKRQLKIAEESLENAKTNLSILRDYFASGRPPQQDYIRLRTDVASRSSQLLDAQKNLQQAKVSFRTLLGLPADTIVEVTDEPQSDPKVIASNQLKNKAFQNHPSIRLLEKQMLYAESLSKATESKLYPSLGLFYNFSLSERSNRELYLTDSQIDTSVIGISLSWDIWSGGKNRAEIAKSQIMVQEIELEKVREKDRIQQALQEKLIEYRSLKNTIENDRTSVKLAKESFRVSQNRFRTGKTSVTELNSSEMQLYQTMLSLALHQFQMQEAKASIHKLTSEEG